MASAPRTNSPAASASASRWRAPWSASRKCCCWMNRLGALDKKLREEMQIELRQLQRTRRHHLRLRDPRSGRGADPLRPDRGHVAAARSCRSIAPTRLYEAPNCREVAEFIGSMNFFQGTLRHAGGGRAVVDAGPLGSLNAMLEGAPPPVGAAVSIAVRPEKLRLAWERPDGHRQCGGRQGQRPRLFRRSQPLLHFSPGQRSADRRCASERRSQFG